MSDWDFLHDMHNEGYSPQQIADAAACGYNPWEWQPIDEKELREIGLQKADPELVQIFESIVDNAMSYHALTGRYLQIWGELGELFAEVAYGIKRHKPYTSGSDGRLGDDFIEIKTISPEKGNEHVQVKSSGNFNKLLVVKISKDFEFQAELTARKNLKKSDGAHLQTSWSKLTGNGQGKNA